MNPFTRRINRWRFKKSVKRLRDEEFCIIANNCVGSRIYQILKIRYNTPCVGLFIKPDCFVKLAIDFDDYIHTPLRFTKQSKYPGYPLPNTNYPVGLLNDIEIHFLHYATEEKAATKWNERIKRIDKNNLYYSMVADQTTSPDTITRFLQKAATPRVCFHNNSKINLPDSIYIPPVDGIMGNLYSKYERFVGHFDFADWILNSTPQKSSNQNRIDSNPSDHGQAI